MLPVVDRIQAQSNKIATCTGMNDSLEHLPIWFSVQQKVSFTLKYIIQVKLFIKQLSTRRRYKHALFRRLQTAVTVMEVLEFKPKSLNPD